MSYLDTQNEPNIKCPYCGWENHDSWEVGADSGKYDCGSCEKAFDYERDVQVTYSTHKLFEDCDHADVSNYKGYFSCDDCGTFDKIDRKPEYTEILKIKGIL
jgi:transposase-like protein